MSRIINNPTELILNTAKNILFRDGYSKLSMRNIARECNIGIGTIYNYFPTKRDLVIDMMTVYWNNSFDVLEEIVNNNAPFFIKLQNIFNKLEEFLNTFRNIWLRTELYESPGYIKNSLERHTIYNEKLLRIFEAFLVSESTGANPTIKLKFDSYDTAKYIILNYITLIQMPMLSYESFELFIKELLQ